MGSLPIINALSINGNVQNNEKNNIVNHIEEYDITSPNYKNKKKISYSKTTNNNTNKIVNIGKNLNFNNINNNKNNVTIPLKSLLKQIGEAITQNQSSQNIANLISKIPNNQNKNTTIRFIKK